MAYCTNSGDEGSKALQGRRAALLLSSVQECRYGYLNKTRTTLNAKCNDIGSSFLRDCAMKRGELKIKKLQIKSPLKIGSSCAMQAKGTCRDSPASTSDIRPSCHDGRMVFESNFAGQTRSGEEIGRNGVVTVLRALKACNTQKILARTKTVSLAGRATVQRPYYMNGRSEDNSATRCMRCDTAHREDDSWARQIGTGRKHNMLLVTL